jgi:hypothetical protein
MKQRHVGRGILVTKMLSSRCHKIAHAHMHLRYRIPPVYVRTQAAGSRGGQTEYSSQPKIYMRIVYRHVVRHRRVNGRPRATASTRRQRVPGRARVYALLQSACVSGDDVAKTVGPGSIPFRKRPRLLRSRTLMARPAAAGHRSSGVQRSAYVHSILRVRTCRLAIAVRYAIARSPGLAPWKSCRLSFFLRECKKEEEKSHW